VVKVAREPAVKTLLRGRCPCTWNASTFYSHRGSRSWESSRDCCAVPFSLPMNRRSPRPCKSLSHLGQRFVIDGSWPQCASELRRSRLTMNRRWAARSWGAPVLWRFSLEHSGRIESARGLAQSKTLARGRRFRAPMRDILFQGILSHASLPLGEGETTASTGCDRTRSACASSRLPCPPFPAPDTSGLRSEGRGEGERDELRHRLRIGQAHLLL